jgi:Ca2+-dependent lipid-binding protein
MFIQQISSNRVSCSASTSPDWWVEIGRTETSKDSHSPQWEKKFVVNYSFEERQKVKLEIYDSDKKSGRLEEQGGNSKTIRIYILFVKIFP